MTEREVDYLRIYTSILKYVGGVHLEEFMKRIRQPVEISAPVLTGWEQKVQNYGKMTLPTQYILMVEDKSVEHDVCDWELHYEKPICKEIIGTIYFNGLEMSMEGLEEMNLTEIIFEDIFSNIIEYRARDELYLRIEIYCPGVFDIAQEVSFWVPQVDIQERKRLMCEELRLLPRPKQNELFGKVFPGGILFQETKNDFYHKLSCISLDDNQ